MYRKLSLLVLGLMMVGGVARADVVDHKDLEISKNIAAKVSHYSRFTIFDDVNGLVNNGVVTLTGKVTMPYKRDEIAKRVASVDGVRQVRNEIGVLPVSNMDDQLRHRIARAIYSNPILQMYGLGANPSIHIIVDHRHVTLTGVVNSDVDRRVARDLADQFPAASVTNNLKTSAEVRAESEHSH